MNRAPDRSDGLRELLGPPGLDPRPDGAPHHDVPGPDQHVLRRDVVQRTRLHRDGRLVLRLQDDSGRGHL